MAHGWFVGDYVQGWLQAYNSTNGQITNVRDFAPAGFDGVDLELTPEGDLAYMHFTDGTSTAPARADHLYRQPPPPAVASRHADVRLGAAARRLQCRRVGRPDGDGHLRLGLRRRRGARHHAHRQPHLQRPGAYTATVTVRDSHGAAGEDSVEILVNRSPPVATIVTPADGSHFRHGVPVHLQGTGHRRRRRHPAGERVRLAHPASPRQPHPHGGDLTGRNVQFTPPGDHDADSYYASRCG